MFDNDNDNINDDATPTADEDPTISGSSEEPLPEIPDDLTQDEDFFNALVSMISDLEKEDKDA